MSEIHPPHPNDFVVQIASINGSGSQSANNVLVRTLFRMGVPVGGKNLFPSNIQGLPTWFTIRAHPKGYVSRRRFSDIMVAMNPSTVLEDQKALREGGLLILNGDMKIDASQWRADVSVIPIPCRELIQNVTDSIKLKKLLVNMTYVGVLARLLGLNRDVLDGVIKDQFGHNEEIININHKTIEEGYQWAAQGNFESLCPWRAEDVTGGSLGKILIDGNTAAGLGLIYGGCTVAAWYPITPSSSLIESFESLVHEVRRDESGLQTAAIVQAEDELASISMVVGAGWAGARAMTATSGPGLSLMAEAAGLAYFAEIPAVIWDVQRVGPSTGLPTRTMQGDVLAAAHLSHGDTKHPLLLPANPRECFEFAGVAFDLAEQLQTLVIVLSDLDLGMNFHMSEEFAYPDQNWKRGKILTAEDLEKVAEFARYKDLDGDGIPYRTLPGTEHPRAAYFTRGTGHDETAKYSESPHTFKSNLERLAKKWQTAKLLMPKPLLHGAMKGEVGLIVYGTTDAIIPETLSILADHNISPDVLRLRAYPFSEEISQFISGHQRTYVIEQNRDAQMLTLIKEELSLPPSACLEPILRFDGWPLEAMDLASEVIQKESGR